MDGGIDPLWPRLKRSAMNQVERGKATISRYAIWGNTVADNLLEALDSLDRNDPDEAKRLILRAANSLKAFAELQRLLDKE
jgi:hypothetical protein